MELCADKADTTGAAQVSTKGKALVTRQMHAAVFIEKALSESRVDLC